jgi:calcineurin-like phosphoesterase family protein
VIYVTSDWHLGHVKIEGYCGRPPDWTERIWEGVQRVQPGDTLIHLGDYAFRQRRDDLDEMWRRMPDCRRILVMGNHDKRSKNHRLPWDAVVKPCEQPLMVGDLGVVILLAHTPEMCPDGFDGIYVHGHLHEKGTLYRWAGRTLMVNVSVEQTNYLPLTLDEIVAEYRLIESGKST